MNATRPALLLAALLGIHCEHHRAGTQRTTPATSAPSLVSRDAPPPSQPAASDASAVTRRCLPLVLNGGLCVMPCSAASVDGAGQWRLEFWQRQPVRIESRCGDAGCTEVFTAEMPMGGECIPRAVDTTCHFRGADCVGAQPEPHWPPMS